MKAQFFLSLLILVFAACVQAQKVLPAISIQDKAPTEILVGEKLLNPIYYTDENGMFVLSFANDSMAQARFFHSVGVYLYYQNIPYIKKGDTIVLNNASTGRVTSSICHHFESETINLNQDIPIILKFFEQYDSEKKNEKQQCRLIYEGVFYLDTVVQQIYIPYEKSYCRYANVIVVSINNYHVRLNKESDYSRIDSDSTAYLKIDLHNIYDRILEALFNQFPLVVRDDAIIPIDKSKNYQCWIDNGFVFPTMKKGEGHPDKARGIYYWDLGLAGTKYEY